MDHPYRHLVRKLPKTLLTLHAYIEKGGFEAYVVGGGVRDLLLGKKPKDYDLASSATPEELSALLRGIPRLKILKHAKAFGTLGVYHQRQFFEITTFRQESDYHDYRHPQSVSFVRSIELDLKRRDLSINALALHPTKGLLDLHGGLKDLKARLLRLVGNPSVRLQEDALRILRVLRLASTLGFVIEPQSAHALIQHAPLLARIAKERITNEFCKLLLGNFVGVVCIDYQEILESFLGVPLCSSHLKNLGNTPPNLLSRLLVCIQHLNPTQLNTLQEHLKLPKKTTKALNKLHAYIQNARPCENRVWVKQQLQILSLSAFRAFLGWLASTNKPLSVALRTHLKETKQAVYSLEFLKIKGKHLKAIGLKGAQFKACLQYCLQSVILEQTPNELPCLFALARRWADKLRQD
ncbi:CCA tRNA nucleotidyltransferase [Helicobacter bizzozeronii]|uniref:CCA tRNA nucleotidyltransferase n=1 Tax=Helicobacter bizzozeronii TaxID=56877 RepID=UPI000CF1564E|nr:CCA tRNA nucleotidyltransferase [Helicobacter bizzozeronii]